MARDTRLGEMQVDLRGKKSKTYTQTVQVGFFPLTLTPATAVTEQVIQIEGEEFLARTCITDITVGERTIDEATNGDRVINNASDCVDTDSNGKLTSTFLVPRGLTPGEYSVVVRDAGNRVGRSTAGGSQAGNHSGPDDQSARQHGDRGRGKLPGR